MYRQACLHLKSPSICAFVSIAKKCLFFFFLLCRYSFDREVVAVVAGVLVSFPRENVKVST